MDNYKDKYDNIVSKLLELIEKEKLLDKVDKELEKNLESRDICDEEIEQLKEKFYNMKHEVIVAKSNKCLGRALFFSLISGFLFIYVGVVLFPSLWFAVLYLFLNIIAHHNIYFKKVNNKEYMFGELEKSSEYICLKEQLDNKYRERNKLELDYEILSNESTDCYLETEYLYTMLYGFALDEVDNGVEVALENGYQEEIEYALNKGLVRRSVRERKKDE